MLARRRGGAARPPGIGAAELAAIGITNQRETTVLWERATGRPVAPAIVWQDRRTAERCRELPAELLRARTGPRPRPVLLRHEARVAARAHRPAARRSSRSARSTLARLEADRRPRARHRPDERVPDDAARPDTLDWDDELLDLFGVDRGAAAPARRLVRGRRRGRAARRHAPDRRASRATSRRRSFGHGCFDRGEAKATYGTGSFVLANAGAERGPRPPGCSRRWLRPGGYALEGAILASGAAIQWLRDGLGILADAAESERLARIGRLDGRRHFVPAFAGPRLAALGRGGARPDQRDHARHDPRAPRPRRARGDRVPGRGRARRCFPAASSVLRADGGASANGFLMQFQADLLGCPSRSPPSGRRRRSAPPRSPASRSGRGRPRAIRRPLGAARSTSRRSAGTGPETLREGWQLAVRRALVR